MRATVFAVVLSEAMRRPARAARRYRRASRRERRLLLTALITVVIARVGLSVLPFRLVARIAARSRRTAAAEAPTPQAIADAIGAAARLVPRSTCLVQALAGQALMQRYGHASRLKIGVARAGVGRFDAHAWLETNEGPLIGAEDLGGYTTLLSSPGP